MAHPGDADRAIAGSVARWTRAGTLAHLICCTSGDTEADDVRTDPLRLAAAREAEQRAAADMLGYADVTFLHRPDGALVNDLALREQLVRVIRAVRPTAVAASDPTVVIDPTGLIAHVDHREAALAAIDAVYPAAGNAMTFSHLMTDEGLEPTRVKRLYLFWSPAAATAVDISSTLEIKLAAIRAHASQLRRCGDAEGHARLTAAEAGRSLGVDAAEAFRVIDLGSR